MWPFKKKTCGSAAGTGGQAIWRDVTKHETCPICGQVNHGADMVSAKRPIYYCGLIVGEQPFTVCHVCIAGTEYDRRQPDNDRRKPVKKKGRAGRRV